MATLEESLAYVKLAAARTAQIQEHAPMLVWEDPSGNLSHAIMVGNKDAVSLGCQRLLAESDAIYYLFITEAATARVPMGPNADAEIKRLGKVGVLSLPPEERQDVIMIFAAKRGEPTDVYIADIKISAGHRELGAWREIPRQDTTIARFSFRW